MKQQNFLFSYETSYDPNDFVHVSALTIVKEIDTQFLCIFGVKGSGKTHLINILKYHQGYEDWIFIDDVHHVNEVNLCHIYNESKIKNTKILITTHPDYTPILADWRSRFLTFYKIELDTCNDAVIEKIFKKILSDYGIEVDETVINYLLKYFDRSYANITKMAHYFGKMHKTPSVNLLKKMLG
jgi:chromosomal replication initiation ATPase DnaA